MFLDAPIRFQNRSHRLIQPMMFVLLAFAFSAGLIAGIFMPQAPVRSVDTRQMRGVAGAAQ
jgi:hypothetical protein